MARLSMKEKREIRLKLPNDRAFTMANTVGTLEFLYSLGFGFGVDLVEMSTSPPYIELLTNSPRLYLRDDKRSVHKTLAELKAYHTEKQGMTMPVMPVMPTAQPVTLTQALQKYVGDNFATPVLFRGQCVKDFTKETYLRNIRILNAEISSYEDISNSSAVDALVGNIEADLKRLTKLFDEHMKGE